MTNEAETQKNDPQQQTRQPQGGHDELFSESDPQKTSAGHFPEESIAGKRTSAHRSRETRR